MDEPYLITLEFKGPVDADGHIQLGDLVHFLQAMLNTVRQADREATGGHSVQVRIVGLSHASPYVVTAQLLASDPKRDEREKVMTGIGRVRNLIERPEEKPDVPYSVLEAFEDLTAQIGKAVPDATLTVGNNVIPLSPALRQQISLALAPVTSAIGSIEGRLESINIHGGANVFNIYPTIGPSKVKCRFPKRMEEEATTAVGKHVRVHGITRYRSGARFPNEVDVTHIEALKPNDELPTLGSLHGACPDDSREPSEDAVRRARNGWT